MKRMKYINTSSKENADLDDIVSSMLYVFVQGHLRKNPN